MALGWDEVDSARVLNTEADQIVLSAPDLVVRYGSGDWSHVLRDIVERFADLHADA